MFQCCYLSEHVYVCVCVCVCVCMRVLSRFSPVQLYATLWTVAFQAPLSMGFSRQEHWCGLPCFPPGSLPDPEVESVSLMSPALAGGFFTARATWEALSESSLIVIKHTSFKRGGNKGEKRKRNWRDQLRVVRTGVTHSFCFNETGLLSELLNTPDTVMPQDFGTGCCLRPECSSCLWPSVWLAHLLLAAFIFNWRIIALHCGIGFCCTTWINSHTCICAPPLEAPPHPSHPLGHHGAPSWAPCAI